MKRLGRITVLTIFLLVSALFLHINAFAEDAADETIKVNLNDRQLPLQVAPTIIDDRTMVPLRDIFEALGVNVEWVGSTRSINAIKGTHWVKLQIGNKKATINGVPKELDVAPTIIDSRTLVPLRFIAESFNAKVDWNGKTRTVNISYNNADNTADSTITPPLQIPGDHKWSILDTEYCRVYYYQNETFVKYSVSEIDKIICSLIEKFGMNPSTSILNNNKVAIYFSEQSVMDEFLKMSRKGVQGVWSGDDLAMFISLDVELLNMNVISMLTHELIHAVTSYGAQSVSKNVPGWYREGIAVIYQYDLKNGGNIDYGTVKDAIKSGKLQPWSSITPSSGGWVDDTYLKYAESATIVGFLTEKYGEKEVIKLMKTEGNFSDALTKLTSKNLKQLEEDWKTFLSTK